MRAAHKAHQSRNRTRNGRTLADNAPEAMLSLVTNMGVPAGLTPAIAAQARRAEFPYVVPA